MSEPHEGPSYYEAPCTNGNKEAPECDGNGNEFAVIAASQYVNDHREDKPPY